MKCRHIILKNHESNFIDVVSGKMVFKAECKCGKVWLTDTLFPMPIFKTLSFHRTLKPEA